MISLSLLLALFITTNDCRTRLDIVHQIAMYEDLHERISAKKDWRDTDDLLDLERRIDALKKQLTENNEA